MTLRNVLLPIYAIKLTQAMIFAVCCLIATVTTAEANGDLIVSGVILGDDLAIANLDCTALANGGKLTTDDVGMVVCSGDDNSGSALSALVARIDALEADNVTLKSQVVALQSVLTANTDADALAHHDKYTNAEAIAAVGSHSPDFSTLLADVSRITDPNTSQDTLRFTDMNVQIVSGSGTTFGTVNGTGNLIIGYNEPPPTLPDGSGVDRTGSHMLVIGERNNYSSYGGMVVGYFNTASGIFASVSGGTNNTASGSHASVSGGRNNTASASYASVSGGYLNTASKTYASVSGGYSNTASGTYASISGGPFNTASAEGASVSGGHSNTARGNYSSVSGGHNRTVNNEFDWRAGSLFENE